MLRLSGSRRRYTGAERREALALAERLGSVAAAARRGRSAKAGSGASLGSVSEEPKGYIEAQGFEPAMNVDGTPMLPGGSWDIQGQVYGHRHHHHDC